MAAEENKTQIAYVPFNTFNSAIESMEHTLPPRLDKTMWPNYSGAIQSQLWSAFRFFGLVNEDGTPTKTLETLVRDKPNRKTHLKKLLEENYPSLMALDLSKATLGHFNEAMKGYGLGTETQKKASSFFLQAAKAADIPLSRFILSNTRTPGLRKKRAVGKTKSNGSAQVNPPAPAIVHAGSGPMMTIQLENGITLTLSASADTFKMTSSDRKWVNDLLEGFERYAQEHEQESEEVEGEDEQP
jgi:hypothetical protein